MCIRDRYEDRRRAGLANRTHQYRLAPFNVCDLQRVAALGRDGAPRAVARLEALSVLRERDALDQRQPRRGMRHKGVEVAIEPAFKTGAIATRRRLRSQCGRRRQRKERSANHCVSRGTAGVYFVCGTDTYLSLIHISEPTRRLSISYAVFCLKK